MHRTKVECGANCLLVDACNAFHFDRTNVCTLLNSEHVYINQDDATPTEIYMKDSDTGMLSSWMYGNNDATLSLHFISYFISK